MSGEPPPGIHHLPTTRLTVMSITLTEPSPRLETNRRLPSLATSKPCVPAPVWRNPSGFDWCVPRSQTPFAAMSAT